MTKSIIYCPFTGLGLFNGFRGQTWYDYRAEIFKNYTLKSLERQKDKSFLLWISFRPEERSNQTTEKIKKDIEKTGLDYVFTFDGLMFWDDKDIEKNRTLKDRLKKSLEKIKPKISDDITHIYMTPIGSDDMFSDDLVEIIRKERYKNGKALFMKEGYVYNSLTKELADWNNPYGIGSYTIMYEKDEFLDAIKHRMKQVNLTTHEQIPEIYLAKETKGKKYCCIVHGKNISTIWNHPFKGRQYFYDKDKKRILKTFNIYD